MIKRNISSFIKKYSSQYPVIAIVGPRQSGKTTLSRSLFPGYKYLSLENLDLRRRASDDPRGFLDDYGANLILDEIQRAPELFSYLQERVDFADKPAQYVVTGSQQFLLMESVTQSLAGRIILARLYPFTLNELWEDVRDTDTESIFKLKIKRASPPPSKIDQILFSGMYPRIHDKKLDPVKWIENYILTYIERDIRSLVNVDNLRLFENFIKVCASNSGQVLNYASISGSTGVSQPTVKKWISLLETSGILFLLPPHHANFRKRVIKTPKLYFIDTGVLCFLLAIRKPDELTGHPLYGNIFETFIISELYKRISHTGEIPPLYFWRDKTGNEIDLLVDFGSKLYPVEIKSSKTFNKDFTSGIRKWFDLPGNENSSGLVIYGGDEVAGKSSSIATVPWWYL
ncbi:MAG: hypothetical protein A2W19_06750 [Spirochaetes bacterium RBG_16_49_21]|nr:MAG: hypothetical protein A2W19_06750 [Spirochaetes bacterium RBG_16_49_21]